MKFLRWLIVAFFGWLCGCKQREEEAFVSVRVERAVGRKIFLERIPYSDTETVFLDSALITSQKPEVRFALPNAQERIYKLRISDRDFELYFVTDQPQICLAGRFRAPKEFAVSSPANNALSAFFRQQAALSEKGRKAFLQADSLYKAGRPPATIDSLKKEWQEAQTMLSQNNLHFADTVGSPASFLLVYNSVDFGRDTRRQKDFMNRAVKRFPNERRIRALQNETLLYAKLLEKELQVGQPMPLLDLPTVDGGRFQTAGLGSKAYFIDFWSSWCTPCLAYIPVKKKALETFGAKNFTVVSIAVDSEKDDCEKIVQQNGMKWPQLIDTRMWQGEAVQKTGIDSIPFNFLVGANGTIVKKAIPADSLLFYLRQYIK